MHRGEGLLVEHDPPVNTQNASCKSCASRGQGGMMDAAEVACGRRASAGTGSTEQRAVDEAARRLSRLRAAAHRSCPGPTVARVAARPLHAGPTHQADQADARL